MQEIMQGFLFIIYMQGIMQGILFMIACRESCTIFVYNWHAVIHAMYFVYNLHVNELCKLTLHSHSAQRALQSEFCKQNIHYSTYLETGWFISQQVHRIALAVYFGDPNGFKNKLYSFKKNTKKSYKPREPFHFRIYFYALCSI